MTNTEIIERVKGFVSDVCGKPASEIGLYDLLEQELGFDSMEIIELELNAESEFCLDLDGQSNGWATVADVCDSVAKALSTPA